MRPTDYCPHCCIVHVTCECPREDETESEYWRRMDRIEYQAPDCRLIFPHSELLAAAAEATGLSTRALAKRIGIDSAKLRSYLRGHRDCPYPVQLTIEALVKPE